VPKTLTLVLLWTFASATWADELPDLIQHISPSVVGVGTAYPLRVPTGGHPARRLLGSGFVVDSELGNVVVTNAHVVATQLDEARGERIAVFSGSGQSARQRFAQVLRKDLEHDLAVLGYEGDSLPAMRLADPKLKRPGVRIGFTGFPTGAILGLYPATHTGIISAVTPLARPADSGQPLTAVQIRRLRNPYLVYQLDAIAYPGNSGSALYELESGSVIGVINSVFVKESRESVIQKPSGITYSIPVVHLHRLLKTPD